MKCSYYRYLDLLNCKVVSKSDSYSYYVIVKGTVYSSYNVYGNDLSILRRILNKKKHLNTKECKTTFLLHNTTSKLLYLKD